MTDQTHYVGDACEGGHTEARMTLDAARGQTLERRLAEFMVRVFRTNLPPRNDTLARQWMGLLAEVGKLEAAAARASGGEQWGSYVTDGYTYEPADLPTFSTPSPDAGVVWDERGPCNGPRDCSGTERGCVVCDPGPRYRELDAGVVEAARKMASILTDLLPVQADHDEPHNGYVGCSETEMGHRVGECPQDLDDDCEIAGIPLGDIRAALAAYASTTAEGEA